MDVVLLRATDSSFCLQLCKVVATALRTCIRLLDRIARRTASIADRLAVHDATWHASRRYALAR